MSNDDAPALGAPVLVAPQTTTTIRYPGVDEGISLYFDTDMATLVALGADGTLYVRPEMTS